MIDGNSSHSSNVERDRFASVDDLYQGLSERVPYRELVEDVGIAPREVGDNKRGVDNILDYLARDDPWLGDLIGSGWRGTPFSGGRSDHMPQNLVRPLAHLSVGLTD